MHGSSPDARGVRAAVPGVLLALVLAVGVGAFGGGGFGVGAFGSSAVGASSSDGSEQVSASADVEVRAPARRTAPLPPRAVRPEAADVARAPQGAGPEGAAAGETRTAASVRALRCVVLRC